MSRKSRIRSKQRLSPAQSRPAGGPSVLEIGANVKPQAQLIWPNAAITTLDADPQFKPDIVGDARELSKALQGRRFDAIFASHVLEHIPWWQTDVVLKDWVACLNPGGSLHIVVPSLEWAARQILSERPSHALIPHMYAGVTTAWDVHVAGFTMRLLRAKLEKAGLAVMRARTGAYQILIGGEPMEAEQHYCAAYRLDGPAGPPARE